ncbi:MAG: universal stress protein [Dehalococcoidia bacterium]|nr:MAG: universal stress protein [Dehalococcoidia bacterium]
MRFLVAWDGSDGARAALRQARALAGAGGQIDLVHVLNPLLDAADVEAPSRHEAMAIVSERARTEMTAHADGAGQHIIVLEHGEEVPDRLLQEAARLHADIIVIASRRAAGLRGVLGSVTQQVLHDTTLPVLVVRA